MKKQILTPLLSLTLLFLPLTKVSAQVLDLVCFETNLGEFCLHLFPEDAPQTVANFLKYVDDGDFDDTIIHRSIPGFVVQAGGFSFENGIGPVAVPKDAPVVNEFKRSNTRGTVAMAKAEGNPNSATSEWFINLGNNGPAGEGLPGLDTQNGGFTVFGEVVSGMLIVDNIVRQPTFDLRPYLGAAFSDTPLLNFDDSFVDTDFITIERAYRTQRDPNAPTDNDPFPNVVTTTTYTSTAFQVPVKWTDGRLFRMLFIENKDAPDPYVFKVETTLIVALNDKGQDRATFNGTTLTIPSAKIPGGIITDIVFRLTDPRKLEFTLESFNHYTGEEPL